MNFASESTGVFPDNRTNIGPRVGFAMDLFGNGKLAIRGGYGEFFARLQNSTIYNALAQTGNPAGQSQVSAVNSNVVLGTEMEICNSSKISNHSGPKHLQAERSFDRRNLLRS